MTVYRTLVYRQSGIDDHRIFPQRRLQSPVSPFHFKEGEGKEVSRLLVSFGKRRAVPLADLMSTTETVAFLVVRDDVMEFEKYSLGYDRTIPSLSFSMAKSVLSILVGCALADGHLKSVDQPVTDHVPEMKRAGFEAVTLRHLLQMTSGIDYAENDLPFGIHARFYYTDRLEKEILNLRLREPPGTRFIYKSGDAGLLTLALSRALGGRSISDYMQERLWIPLGMESDASWSIDHEPDGLEKTWCCLAATARDFAKLGRLYLNRGEWEGRRIVPAAWVADSTTSSGRAGGAWNYQQMWWLVARGRPDFMARGHLGQFLYVNPATRTIIVRLGQGMGGLSGSEWTEVFISVSDAVPRSSGNGGGGNQALHRLEKP